MFGKAFGNKQSTDPGARGVTRPRRVGEIRKAAGWSRLLLNVHDGQLLSVLSCFLKGKLSNLHSLGGNTVASPELGQGWTHRRIPVGPRSEADNKVR